MRLPYLIIKRISTILIVVLTAWAIFFYIAIVDNVRDETDDVLEDFSVMLMRRVLTGEHLPSVDNGSNNTYYIKEVDERYAKKNSAVRYTDEMIYIESKKETEPARVLRYIFKDRNDRFYELTVATPMLDKSDMTESIIVWIGILYALLVIVIIIVNLIVLHSSMRPFRQLLKWLDFGSMDKSTEFPHIETNIVEFKRLNVAMEGFYNRGKDLFNSQKEFIGNASHELQTPIAICQNRLEVLSDTELNEEQIEQINKTLKTLKELSKLNKTLLLLSKIDNGEFESQTITVNSVVLEYFQDFNEVYKYKNIKTKLTQRRDCVVNMNKMLLNTLVVNLLKNSFLHVEDSGEIKIEISSKDIKFINSGNAPLDADKIFQRFFKDSKKEGSTGLGLALVSAICELYSFDLSYNFSNSKHIFRVIFEK